MSVGGFVVLLIVAQAAVEAAPIDNVVQRISVPREEAPMDNAVHRIYLPVIQDAPSSPAQQEEFPVQIQSLYELGEKYDVGNISSMITDMYSTVNTLKNGEQKSFLVAKLGEARYAEFERKLDMALPDTNALQKEAEYLAGRQLPAVGYKMLLRRFIKRFATTQNRFSEAFQDLASALGTVEVTGFFDRLHIAVLRVSYEFSAYLFKKVGDEAEHDYRRLQDL